jgi:osmotically-inducible protein OsmY
MHDRQIEDTIRDDVALSRLWILPEEIDVEVAAGVVTLRGLVADRLTARTLARETGEVAGVVDIVDRLVWQDALAA